MNQNTKEAIRDILTHAEGMHVESLTLQVRPRYIKDSEGRTCGREIEISMKYTGEIRHFVEE